MSQITRFYSVKFVAWKSGSVKELTNIMSGPEGAVFAKAKFGFLLTIPLQFSVFWNKFPTYHRSSLETADSYSFMGDVCPVFTSPPLIPPNWSCLQRDSVSTHRRRHRITDLWVHPTSLRHRDNESNKFETLRHCIQPAWDLVRLSD